MTYLIVFDYYYSNVFENFEEFLNIWEGLYLKFQPTYDKLEVGEILFIEIPV